MRRSKSKQTTLRHRRNIASAPIDLSWKREKSSRRSRARKIFPVDRVRIARIIRLRSRLEISKADRKPGFIEFSRFIPRRESMAPSLQ
jgi:hypothetical protein